MQTDIDRQGLGLTDGIALALGSVIGSGILFLPALTFSIAGDSVAWVWIIATGLCVPLLWIFKDLLDRVETGKGVAGYVELAFGPTAGKIIPLLFLSTVCIGMPSAGLIAGDYITQMIEAPPILTLFVGLSIVWLAALANILGIKFGSMFQKFVTVGLLLMGLALIAVTLPLANASAITIPVHFQFSPVFLGVTVAFWAYAGFENFTFIAHEFRNPKRDPFIAIIVALLICGLIYIGLAINYAMIVPFAEINFTTGLRQMVEHVPAARLYTTLVSLFALFAVLLNFNSWVWGISRMIQGSARGGILPRKLSANSNRGVPLSAIIALSTIFTIVTIIGYSAPDIFKHGLIVVSSNFLIIYLFCIFSFLRLKTSMIARLNGLLLLCPLIIALVQTGVVLVYPLIVISVSYVFLKGRPDVLEK